MDVLTLGDVFILAGRQGTYISPDDRMAADTPLAAPLLSLSESWVGCVTLQGGLPRHRWVCISATGLTTGLQQLLARGFVIVPEGDLARTYP